MKRLINKLNKVFGGNWTMMAGTEGTGEYEVLVGTAKGRLGVRVLPFSFKSVVRVRVEPIEDLSVVFAGAHNWKRPGEDSQKRFSIVTYDGTSLSEALGLALGALQVGGLETAVNLEAFHGIRWEFWGYLRPALEEADAVTLAGVYHRLTGKKVSVSLAASVVIGKIHDYLLPEGDPQGAEEAAAVA